MKASLPFVAFSPDGRTALTCSDDNSARLWDAATGRPSAARSNTWARSTTPRSAPTGRFLVTAGWDFEAQVWDTATSLSQRDDFVTVQPGQPRRLQP